MSSYIRTEPASTKQANNYKPNNIPSQNSPMNSNNNANFFS